MRIKPYLPYLDWIDQQYNRMILILGRWANVNSGSTNLGGLNKMRHMLFEEFSSLNADMKEHDLRPYTQIDEEGNAVLIPSAPALSLIKRPEVRPRIFFGGHFDTVYSVSHDFQKTERISEHIFCGPGVADMKGGLIIMLIALEAFERSPWAQRIGWEILLNSDEEIGSPGSAPLFYEAAGRSLLGLIFEPAMEGSLVNCRKGSLSMTLVVRGKSAHVGRDYHLGRNVIYAVSQFISLLETCNDPSHGVTVNVGKVHGGNAVNVVPDLALCYFNIRMLGVDDLSYIKAKINAFITICKEREGITFELYENSYRPPKPLDNKTMELCEKISRCGKDLNIPITWCTSGGVSDGNLLAASGLPTIDTLGVVGGKIHSSEEYIYLPSLIERAKLTALFLMKGDYL